MPITISPQDLAQAGRIWRATTLTELLAGEGQSLEVVQPPAPGLALDGWALQDPAWTAALAESAIDFIAV